MLKEHMKNIKEFKESATSVWIPGYFREYVEELTEKELEDFYRQVKETLEVIEDEGYLIYKFRWIMKRDFTDLRKEIYIESICNAEGLERDIIKPKWREVLYEEYKEDIQRIFYL